MKGVGGWGARGGVFVTDNIIDFQRDPLYRFQSALDKALVYIKAEAKS